jgi:hypothetical protein
VILAGDIAAARVLQQLLPCMVSLWCESAGLWHQQLLHCYLQS